VVLNDGTRTGCAVFANDSLLLQTAQQGQGSPQRQR